MQQAQMANQQAANQGYLNIHNQQALMNRLQQLPPPTPEEKFMDLIDGKSDEEIVLAFEMLMAEEKRLNEELVKKVQENHQQSSQAKRDNFLTMCKRFRPSINENLLERVSKLKAFW